MPTKLFVASLPSLVTNSELVELFSQYGVITDVRITNFGKGKNLKGFAFVSFKEDSVANLVLGSEVYFRERKLTIRRCLKGKDVKHHTCMFERRRMFVGNLPPSLCDSELKQFFMKYAEVENAYIIRKFGTGVSRNFGYILFQHADDVDRVLGINLILFGKRLVCERFKVKSKNQKPKAQGRNSSSSRIAEQQGTLSPIQEQISGYHTAQGMFRDRQSNETLMRSGRGQHQPGQAVPLDYFFENSHGCQISNLFTQNPDEFILESGQNVGKEKLLNRQPQLFEVKDLVDEFFFSLKDQVKMVDKNHQVSNLRINAPNKLPSMNEAVNCYVKKLKV